KLTRDNIKEPMRDIRRALLEADVSLPVVRRFVREVTERAVGVEVIRGVRPEQQLVKVVNDQLVALMGGNVAEIAYAPEGKGPTVVLMAGLQGVGKTTACGKLALFLKKKGKTSMMVATDVYRPAAIEQLQTLGAQVGVPVYAEGTDARPVDIARQGVAAAKKAGVDVVIVDTAGRLQIDRSMMEELRGIKAAVSPTEVLLVVDAMTGQEAASLVAAFNAEVSITGAILTKVDGDSRGGAALSVKEVSGRPIKFVGEGETMSALEPFYPDRMASRILGMGDVLSLVEKAQELMDKEDEAELRKRIMEAKFDFNDMLKQTRMMARMGSMGGMLKLIPGMNKVSPHRTALHPPPALHPQFHTSALRPQLPHQPPCLCHPPSLLCAHATPYPVCADSSHRSSAPPPPSTPLHPPPPSSTLLHPPSTSITHCDSCLHRCLHSSHADHLCPHRAGAVPPPFTFLVLIILAHALAPPCPSPLPRASHRTARIRGACGPGAACKKPVAPPPHRQRLGQKPGAGERTDLAAVPDASAHEGGGRHGVWQGHARHSRPRHIGCQEGTSPSQQGTSPRQDASCLLHVMATAMCHVSRPCDDSPFGGFLCFGRAVTSMQASSGKAKRKKSRTGFSQQLGDNTAVAAGAKGFGGRN
ncbi:unnamed protein product, partial [Closterium sp. NIES-53]